MTIIDPTVAIDYPQDEMFMKGNPMTSESTTENEKNQR